MNDGEQLMMKDVGVLTLSPPGYRASSEILDRHDDWSLQAYDCCISKVGHAAEAWEVTRNSAEGVSSSLTYRL